MQRLAEWICYDFVSMRLTMFWTPSHAFPGSVARANQSNQKGNRSAERLILNRVAISVFETHLWAITWISYNYTVTVVLTLTDLPPWLRALTWQPELVASGSTCGLSLLLL